MDLGTFSTTLNMDIMWKIEVMEHEYKEMFTVTEYGAPFIEIRRNPASQGATGIHDANECHLRLVNRACYYNNAALLMDELQKNGYTDIRIKRRRLFRLLSV